MATPCPMAICTRTNVERVNFNLRRFLVMALLKYIKKVNEALPDKQNYVPVSNRKGS